MIFPYLYTDMSFKRVFILSILALSAFSHASAQNVPQVSDTIRFDDGSWYLGQIADSLFNGFGKMVYADSTVYEGEWKDGLWEGKGEIRYTDGDSYSGQFSRHEFNGYGTYRYSDGAVYEGYWKDGMFNGSGTMNYADGSIYAGEWSNDMKNGVGVLYESQTGLLLKGEFFNDLFNGPFENEGSIGSGSSYTPVLQPSVNMADPSLYFPPVRPDSCWHYRDDVLLCISYGTKQMLSLHTDIYLSKRFFTGFSIGFNTVGRRMGEASVTYDDETGDKITLIGWDWYPDEIMTEDTFTLFRLSGECGVSWGWFSLGAALGVGMKNTVRNCRSLAQNDSYFEAGTLYYREKITGAKFMYDIFTDFVLNRSMSAFNSISARTGYSNTDGAYLGIGISF